MWHPNAKSSMTNVKKVDTKSWQLLMWLSHDQPSTNYNHGRILPTQFFTHLIILADTDLMQTNERQNWRRMWTRFFILLRAGFETGKWQFLVQVRSRESHFFASLSLSAAQIFTSADFYCADSFLTVLQPLKRNHLFGLLGLVSNPTFVSPVWSPSKN